MSLKYIYKSFCIPLIFNFIASYQTAKAEVLWEQLSKTESNLIKYKGISSPNINEALKENKYINKSRRVGRKEKIKWELVKSINSNKSSIRWRYLSEAESKNTKLFDSNNKYRIPSTFEEAEYAYKFIEPNKKDYIPIIRLAPGFPTANQLESSFSQINIYTLSAFSGGAAGGTGNQNYAIRYDYGFSENIQLSGFYSVADDPLYAKIKSHSAEKTPNYWESYGFSLKFPIVKEDNLKVSLESSLESWNVRSGPPNIFNNSGDIVEKISLISSISIPITWALSKDIELNFNTSYSFLPETIGDSQGGDGKFYGNNIFIGSGINWRPISKLNLISSVMIPLGPGYNSFTSDLNYERNPIFNLGADWNLNPKVSLEGRLTNAFGATPSTGILTLPSSNRLGYYAGFKYNPYALDSPQKQFNYRERSLASGGLTVNTALIPEYGTTQAWANIDNEGNIFGYIGYSLSNSFQLDIINFGYFSNVPKKTGEKADLVRRYTNNTGLKTRVGGKFILLRPTGNLPIWSAIRVSVGRNQDLSSRQGYLFGELITSFDLSKRVTLNINPKIAWNNVSTPQGIGLGANIQLFKNFQLIPEFNLASTKNGDSNGTISLRWLFNENTNIDLYISSAAGLQDMGQLLSSEKPRLGARFNILY